MSNLPTDHELPLVQHLLELRNRLLRIIGIVLVIFIALFYFANDIYSFTAAPLVKFLPEHSSMIATEVTSPFLAPFKLTLFVSVLLAAPFILHQVWGFIAPGLYQHEKRLAAPLLISSVVLFYSGMAFAYFVVFPLVFGFFTSIGPEDVAVMTDISQYLNFVLKLFFAFGIAFEIPIATVLLIHAVLVTPQGMSQKRPYIVVASSLMAILLTPPDVISQTLLAVPMWLLFETGVFFGRITYRRKSANDLQEHEEHL